MHKEGVLPTNIWWMISSDTKSLQLLCSSQAVTVAALNCSVATAPNPVGGTGDMLYHCKQMDKRQRQQRYDTV